jgi:hypothetical protein
MTWCALVRCPLRTRSGPSLWPSHNPCARPQVTCLTSVTAEAMWAVTVPPPPPPLRSFPHMFFHSKVLCHYLWLTTTVTRHNCDTPHTCDQCHPGLAPLLIPGSLGV